jgi:hypothetical protein
VDALAKAVASLPGLAGASLVSYAAAELAHRVAVGLLVAGVFCLLLDWRMR